MQKLSLQPRSKSVPEDEDYSLNEGFATIQDDACWNITTRMLHRFDKVFCCSLVKTKDALVLDGSIDACSHP